MKLQIGSVVKAAAGRDGEGHFVVTEVCKGRCFIANGKSRRLEKPKCKNVKHIRLTNSVIDLNDITDKKLRRLLKDFGGSDE